MSLKIYDGKGRWRSRTVGFRMSPEEDTQLEKAVALSGLTKQDYIIKRLQDREIVVVGNPRVYKALRNLLTDVLTELKRIESSEQVDSELLETIRLITVTMRGLTEESE